MDTLQIIEALNEAVRIIDRSRDCKNSQAIYNLSYHASQHLDRQIAALLAPPAEA